MRAQGSVLVALLWCVALLSIVVIGVLHLTRIDLLVTKNYSDRIQARYLALAGIERAKALLYQDARERSRSARAHGGDLYNAPELFKETRLGRGSFHLFRPGREDEGGGVIFGVSDEESRLNVNAASAEELGRLPGMTPDIVAAIVDWRDADNQASPGGAEIEYYASLRPPYQPRNAPFQSLRELLMVRGISRERLLGRDWELKPALPSEDPDAGASVSPGAGLLEAGWASVLTVDSAAEDLNAAGRERVNVQSADEGTLTTVRGITADIARAIVASRGRNRFQSVADLLDVTAAPPQGQNALPGSRGAPPPEATPGPNAPAPGGPSGAAGPKVIDSSLLMDIADEVTVQTDSLQTGVVNINTAGLEVLACLPGMDRDLAQAVILFRQSNGFYPNIAWLLRVPGITAPIFKQLAPRVTARSATYRILCEGRVPSSGARQRIEAIVRLTSRGFATLSYREDDL